MISIEKVSKGYIDSIEEGEDDYWIVLQKDFNCITIALGSLCLLLIDRWQDESEAVGIKLDVAP